MVGGFLRVLRFPQPVKQTFHQHHHVLDMTVTVLPQYYWRYPNKPKPKSKYGTTSFKLYGNFSLQILTSTRI